MSGTRCIVVESSTLLTRVYSITEDPDNLEAITVLAGMGILTADDGLIDAALSEILALPIDQKREMDPQHHVDYLLIQHHLALVSCRVKFFHTVFPMFHEIQSRYVAVGIILNAI